MVFVVFLENDLKHIIEESVLLVGLGDLSSRLQIGRLVLNSVRDRFLNNFLAKCDKWFSSRSMELVFEVSESLARDLNVSLDEVAADTWVKFIQVRTKDNVVFALQEQVV